MDVSITPEWESFVEQAVEEGRFDSAADVVRAGLGLLKERERQLQTLRATIDASLAEGGSLSSDEVLSHVASALSKRRRSKVAA